MSPKKKNIVTDIICFLLMLLFVYAAISKLRDYEAFKTQLGQSPLLTAYVGFVAWFIPTLELALTVLLFFDTTRLPALYGTYTLMTSFTAYIITITRFSEYVPCSCGGVLQNMTWDQHLLFNAGIIILNLIAIILYDRNAPKLFFAKNREIADAC
ncbi:MAG TPA: MauE/DoxX family redox-associated membrane protein [Puia sp.]|jgi:uncharacterized membrane protein YphA (DoxX/SURF4 family)